MHHSFDQNDLKLTRINSGVYSLAARFATSHNHRLAKFVLQSGGILFSFWESNTSLPGTEKRRKTQVLKTSSNNLIVSGRTNALRDIYTMGERGTAMQFDDSTNVLEAVGSVFDLFATTISETMSGKSLVVALVI